MQFNFKLEIFGTILMVGILGFLSQSSTSEVGATLEIPQSATTTEAENYTTYTSTKYGISFEYPADWKLTEKTNRFDSGPDVEVNEGLNAFKFSNKDDRITTDNSFIDLDFITTMAQNSFVKSEEGDRLIESASTDDYKIDGYETGSFLYTAPDPFDIKGGFFDLDTASLILMIDKGGDVYTIGYQDLVKDFDTPEGEAIRNHILNSFHFLDSDSSSNDDDDDEERSSNDEEDNN